MCIYSAYIIIFRWLCYCHVPSNCDSLPKYDTTQIFGRTLLKSVFQTMRKQLLDKFKAEKEKMPPEKRTLVLTHFPKYVHVYYIHELVRFLKNELNIYINRKKYSAFLIMNGTRISFVIFHKNKNIS